VPGIANIPILGQLFRSKNNNRSVVELVILVTATVVDPLRSDGPLPAEPKFVVPNLDSNAFDALDHGKTTQPVSTPQPPSTQTAPNIRGQVN
jgi:Flp pilus assembly secretin CpaC